MSEYPGGDTLGIVTDVPSGQVDSLNQPVTTESVVWVYGCVFDPVASGPSEEQTNTTTNSERAWVFMPLVGATGIPTVDTSGDPILDVNGDQVYVTEIPNTARIRPKRTLMLGQRDYKVIGRPEVQYDLGGEPDHVWIICEWRGPQP